MATGLSRKLFCLIASALLWVWCNYSNSVCDQWL